jgi:tetratricopeptide (TPR) repeat protein
VAKNLGELTPLRAFMGLLLVWLWAAAPWPAMAASASVVPQGEVVSDFQARWELARLFSYGEKTLPRAGALYEKLATSDPGNPLLQVEWAGVLARLGQFKRAEALFLKALAAAPSDPAAYEGLGDAYLAAGRLEEAAEAYGRAASLTKGSPTLAGKQARVLVWSGQHDEALPLLLETRQAYPEDKKTALLLAQVYLAKGEHSQAAALADELALDPVDGSNWLAELAEVEAGLGHAILCRDLFAKALAVVFSESPESPEYAGLVERRADVMLLWGDFHKAATAYGKLLDQGGPDRQLSLKRAGVWAASQRYEEAEGLYRKMLLHDPLDPEAVDGLARIKLLEKNPASALNVLEPFLAIAPERATARKLQGESLLALHRDKKAQRVLSALVEDDPTTEHLLLLVRAQQKTGQEEAARTTLIRAYEMAPGVPAVRYALLGQEYTGSEAFLDTLATEERSPKILNQWAGLYALDGRYAPALSCLEAALALDPKYFPAQMARAEILAYSRQYKESIETLRTLDQEFPGVSKIKLTLARVLGWSRQYDASLAEYQLLHDSDLEDPVPLKEMARTAFWGKRYVNGTAAYELLLTPSVDSRLVAGLKDMATGAGQGHLAERVEEMERRAGAASPYTAYEALVLESEKLAPAEQEDVVALLVELLPTYRVQKAAYLEREAKILSWNTHFARALDGYDALLAFQPGNEEAWFDKGQAECSLGLCEAEAGTYEKLLDIDPLHLLAARALERRRIRNKPALRAGFSLWQEQGRGEAARMERTRMDLEASVPVECGVRLKAALHRWLESPGKGAGNYRALGQTVGVEAVFNRYFRGAASWTGKRYQNRGVGGSDLGRARLEANLNDYARVGLGVERTAEAANRFALRRGVRSDSLWLDVSSRLSRKWDLAGEVRYKKYNDANTGKMAQLALGRIVTDHPRLFKVTVSGEYRDTAKKNQSVFSGGELTGMVHPYWTPQDYWGTALILEWEHDLSEEFQCGEERHVYNIRLVLGQDSEDNSSVRLEAEWLYEFWDQWELTVSGLIHRSREWDAHGLWTGVRRSF